MNDIAIDANVRAVHMAREHQARILEGKAEHLAAARKWAWDNKVEALAIDRKQRPAPIHVARPNPITVPADPMIRDGREILLNAFKDAGITVVEIRGESGGDIYTACEIRLRVEGSTNLKKIIVKDEDAPSGEREIEINSPPGTSTFTRMAFVSVSAAISHGQLTIRHGSESEKSNNESKTDRRSGMARQITQ